MIVGDICCQKKQTDPILVEGEWSYDDFKTDTFTVMYDCEGANGLRDLHRLHRMLQMHIIITHDGRRGHVLVSDHCQILPRTNFGGNSLKTTFRLSSCDL